MPIADQLRSIVGDRHVLLRDTQLLSYAADGLPGYHKKPRLAVFPGSRSEVLAVLRTLADAKIPFVPRGAGTGLSGGALADDVVLLGLHRLKRITHIDDAAQIAVVEPGVVNAALNRVLAPRGLLYAPDPSSETACTIGGNVAENSGGPHCLKYGVTLNHVLSATVALPNGDVVTLGNPQGDGKATMRGYDLIGAFVGSEGCFGVILDVTVRLTRKPAAIRTLLADFLTIDDAAYATSTIIASGVVPAALEFMDGPMIRAVEASVYAAGYPADAAAVLLIELDGNEADVELESQLVQELCAAHRARTVRVARNEAERATLWLGRKKAFGAMGRVASHMALQDAVIPRTKLPEILAKVQEVSTRYNVTICNVFHAGDGNLHPIVAYHGADADEVERTHHAMHEIVEACIEAGGSITGEHGVGLDKLPYMTDLFSADTLTAMCDLRSAFDAERRANPGKVVPTHSCREWTGSHASLAKLTPAVTAPRDAVSPVAIDHPNDRAIAERIRVATESGNTIRIAGLGTWLNGGYPVVADETLSLADDTGVIAYVPGDLTITVRAGTTLEELATVLGQHDQWLPLDPLGRDSRNTIGAVIATGSFGPLAQYYGTPRDQILGLTAVTGHGAIVHAGGRVVKNVAGFDLTRLFTGSWGTLGVITQVTMRVRSKGGTTGSLEHMRQPLLDKHGFREPEVVNATISRAIKDRFDPAGILNPGIMGAW